MKFDYLYAIPVFIILLLIQTIIVPIISLDNYVPNLILISLVFFSLRNGKLFGSLAGFLMGLCVDIVTGTVIGSSMFTLTLTGFVAGVFHNENKTGNYLTSYYFLLIVFLCSIINEGFSFIILGFSFNKNFLTVLANHIIFTGLYTTFLSTIVIIVFPKQRYI